MPLEYEAILQDVSKPSRFNDTIQRHLGYTSAPLAKELPTRSCALCFHVKNIA